MQNHFLTDFFFQKVTVYLYDFFWGSTVLYESSAFTVMRTNNSHAKHDRMKRDPETNEEYVSRVYCP